ncbi:MAG: hypothetical protein EOO16_03260 [Chitinophagaceae bacterium]|nr:MAG: hypothetical protein EOO16_03260 [Chitinophagaceae bacterium]
MNKAKRVGRPPLSEDEKSVPTMIRLLPSVREVIKSEAERQDMKIGEFLRTLVEGRAIEIEPKFKFKATVIPFVHPGSTKDDFLKAMK